jgi:hypothetical protein
MKWLKRILVVVLLLAIAGFLVWKYVINRNIANNKDAKPDYTISMQDLLKEFSNNDSATSKKYIGKLISVTGNVKEVLMSDSATTINLGDTSSNNTIVCQIDARNNAAAKLVKPNTQITVKGELAGINNQNTDPLFAGMGVSLGTDFVFKYCSIVTK